MANLWRTVGDVQATWESVMDNIHANDKMAPVVNGGQPRKHGQGNFNDADMLEVHQRLGPRRPHTTAHHRAAPPPPTLPLLHTRRWATSASP